MHNETGEKASTGTARWNPPGGPRFLLRLTLVFVVSRLAYFAVGVRPDTEPLNYYMQCIDPALLRDHLWQSLMYLRQQPPGFNLYLGLVLKASGHPEAIFFVVQSLMGLALALALMTVMIRLGVANWLAFLLAAAFTASPITVLYENWVFYEYPVMFALTAGAWATERYVRATRFRDGLLLFAALAMVVSIRGVYHLIWFLILASLLLWVTRGRWRTGLAAVAVPSLLIGAFYVRNFVVFGDVLPGEFYRKLNYAQMIQQQASPDVLARLKREGRIGGILEIEMTAATDSFGRFVKPPAPTGIPLIDMWWKTTGADNWNSSWRSQVIDCYYRDAQVVARECPGLLARHLLLNLRTYFEPASDLFPFDEARNAQCLRPFLTWYERTTAGQLSLGDDPDHPIAWLNVVLLPACLVGGLILAARAFSKAGAQSRESLSRCATILFLLFNIAYNLVVTVRFSSSDHNRYREEVAPLYVVLLGLLASALWVRLRGRHNKSEGGIR